MRSSGPPPRRCAKRNYGIWQTLTWAELAPHGARTWPAACAEAGLQRGEHMVVVGANRPRLYATMLAAQSLGAIPVPLYQDAAAAEFVFPINNAEVRFAHRRRPGAGRQAARAARAVPAARAHLVRRPARAAQLRRTGPGVAGRLIEAGRAYDAAHPGFFDAEVAQGQPDDVAAMFFTSGTTGNPKGVVHTHLTLLDRAAAGRRSTS